MTSIKSEGHVIWSTDVAVPISRLADLISKSWVKESTMALGRSETRLANRVVK